MSFLKYLKSEANKPEEIEYVPGVFGTFGKPLKVKDGPNGKTYTGAADFGGDQKKPSFTLKNAVELNDKAQKDLNLLVKGLTKLKANGISPFITITKNQLQVKLAFKNNSERPELKDPRGYNGISEFGIRPSGISAMPTDKHASEVFDWIVSQ
jgi:hypothetical protein